MWVICLLSLLLSIAGTLFLDGITCEHNRFVYWTSTLLFTLLCYKMQDWIKEKRRCLQVWYLLCLVCSILFIKQLWNGSKMIVSCLLEAMNEYYETGFQNILVSSNPWQVPILMVWITMLVMPHIVWEEYKNIKWWFLFEDVMVSVGVGLLLGNAPNAVLLVLAVMSLVVYRIYGMEQQYAGGRKGVFFVPMQIVLVIMACSILAGYSVTESSHRYHDSFQEYINHIEDRFRLFDWAGIGEGNLTNEAPVKTHKAMFAVSFDNFINSNVYFPGFTGGDYTNGRWKRLSTSRYEKMLKDNKMTQLDVTLQLQTSPYYKMVDYAWDVACVIEYKGVQDSYAYFPYFSNYFAQRDMLDENGDGKLRRSSNKSVYVRFCENYDLIDSIEYGLEDWDEFYEDEHLPETARRNNAYAQYVKETYLTVPDRLKEELLDYMGDEAEEAKEDMSVIPSILARNAEYSLELEDLKFGEDYVEHFLFEEKKGYCSHFATAATLMYRSVGIPARYVTGYMLKPEKVEENDAEQIGNSVTVTDDDGHAWVEIYINHLGWIPVEVTPGYASSYSYDEEMEEAYEIWDEEENVESSQANNPSVTTQSAKQETATEKQEAAGFSHGKGKNAFWQKAGKVIAVIGKLIALVIFVSGIIIGKHKWERYMRHHKDADIAIAAIKKQLLRYMKLNGYLKEEGEAEKAYFMRAACGLWKKRIEANHGTKENRKMTAKAEESIEQLPQNSEAAGEIEPMIEAFWSVLEKQAFSRRNLVKSDVRTCNQLFDCLVEGKF